MEETTREQLTDKVNLFRVSTIIILELMIAMPSPK